jgi:hypothetical protein
VRACRSLFSVPAEASFYVSDPLNLAELGFFLLLAVIASKAVTVVTDDVRRRNAPSASAPCLAAKEPA